MSFGSKTPRADTAASAASSPVKGAGHLIELDPLDCCAPISPERADEAARRYLTLVTASKDSTRRGGTGCITKVFNSYGEVFCLKSLLGVDDRAIGRKRAAAIFRGRAKAFHEEYIVQRAVSGIDGWPATYGFGFYAGGPVILMDWLEGRTLRSMVPYLPRASKNSYGMAPEWIASIGIRVLQFLLAAESRDPGFVHRDISPRNIMVRLDRVPLRNQLAQGMLDLVLIDLGSATSVDAEQIAAAAALGFTQQTDIWRNGTIEYAAPEMLTHDAPGIEALRHSPKLDVYALCSVLYELYCGHTPYQLEERPGLSPYRVKLDYAPVGIAPRERGDEELLHCIILGLSAAQEARPGTYELCSMLMNWLGLRAPAMAQMLAANPPLIRYETPLRDLQLVPLSYQAGGLRGADSRLPEVLERRMK